MSLYTHSRARRSLIDTVWFRALSQLAGVLGLVVMVRGMSKQDFGTFSLLYAFIPVISSVASFGLMQTLRRYLPEYLKRGDRAAAGWLVRIVASARLGTNVILLTIILLTWNYVAPFFKLGPYRIDFAYFCLLAMLFFQARILQIALAAYMLHQYSVGSIAIIAMVKLIAYSLLSWQDLLDVRNAIVADTVAFGMAYLFMTGAYRRHCVMEVPSIKYRPDPTERRRLVRYAIFNNFNDAGTVMLTTKTDNFFIAAFIDPISVGIYAFYTRLSNMAYNLLPVNLFENVVQPVFFSTGADEADRKVPQHFSLLLNLNLMLQWPILAYATAFHAEIVQVVFGGKFIEHSWLLPVVVGFATLDVVSTPVTLVAQHEERPGIILVSKLFGIYNVIALIALLPVMGVYGAAIATGSAQAIKNAYIWWNVRKRARWTNAGSALIFGILLWGVTIVACRTLGTMLQGVPIISLSAGAIVVAAAGLLHARGPAVSPDDRRILSGIFGGKEARWLRRIGLLSHD